MNLFKIHFNLMYALVKILFSLVAVQSILFFLFLHPGNLLFLLAFLFGVIQRCYHRLSIIISLSLLGHLLLTHFQFL